MKRKNQRCGSQKRIGHKLLECGRKRRHKKKHRTRGRHRIGGNRVTSVQIEWE
jgi:hypothetical protein